MAPLLLAVADAVVVATRDDMPAQAADQRSVAMGDATGNFIALDLGGRQYVFYEHLKPGVLVKPGQRVRRGQVIGALGSSGQATQPHLHLHLSDARSPLGAEGLPFRIAEVEIIGGYVSLDGFLKGGAWSPRPRPASAGPFFPSPNLVVSFPE